MAKEKKDTTIFTQTVEQGSLNLVLVGITPLVLNRLSEKAKHELLLPHGKKSAADKAANLKHNPIEEFKASAHVMKDAGSPTLLAFPTAGFKKAMASAALDMPGTNTSKAQIGRLVWVPGEFLPVYGVPKLFMAAVRNSDIKKTPDIRTRVIVPEWAMVATVDFVTPVVNPTVIINLAAASGLYIGVGDGRNEKGALTYGQYRIMSTEQAATDPKVSAILKVGRVIQKAAFNKPEPYNEETAELLGWYQTEVNTRGRAAHAG